MGHRKKPDCIVSLDRFAEDMETMHQTVIGYSMRLRVTSDHYRAMQELHQKILETIERVTGKEAPWINRGLTAPRTNPKP